MSKRYEKKNAKLSRSIAPNGENSILLINEKDKYAESARSCFASKIE